MKKKLLLFCLLVGFIVPLQAADLDVYGKFYTGAWWLKNDKWYWDTVSIDTAHYIDSFGIERAETTNVEYGVDSIPYTSCNFMPKGSFGVKFKSDMFGGTIELGVNDNSYMLKLHGRGGTGLALMKKLNTFAYMKKWYVECYLNDYLTWLIGKNTAPACFFPSNQSFWGGNSFNNIGCLFTGSNPMVQLSFHDPELKFEGKVAVIKVDTSIVLIKNKYTDESSQDTTRYYGEVRFPKIEGSFGMNLEWGIVGFNAKIAGGFQRYYSVIQKKEIDPNESKLNIDSYVIGADLGLKFGKISFAFDGFYGMNIGAYGVYIGDSFGWWREARYMRVFYPIQEVILDAMGQPTDEAIMRNGTVIEAAGIVKYKASELLSFEGGGGTVVGDHDFAEYENQWNETYAWYFQTEMTLFEMLKITPEIGQYIYGPEIGFGRYLYWGISTYIEF